MSPAPPHLLYVAWGFPPARTGGVYRALATANAFAGAGWRVTVLTVEREVWERFTGTDDSLDDLIDPRIEIVRVPFGWPLQETDLRRWSKSRVFAPALWRRWTRRSTRAAFPEVSYGAWRRTLERAAVGVHQRLPVDLVIATANPHVAFLAGRVLKARFGVPYVMDYRDAWTLDVFSGKDLTAQDRRAARWQDRLLAGAREVWFVNERIADWHRERYPEVSQRIFVVPNGWDPVPGTPDARTDQRATGQAASTDSTSRPLVFGYLGTVSRWVPMTPFLAGWRAAGHRGGPLRDATARIHGYLGFYRTAEVEVRAAIADAAGDGVTYEGPVAKASVSAVYDTFDVLLLILGTGRYVTSGKVFEYMATGKPIVSVHDPGNAVSDVLRDYPLWFPATSLDPEAIAGALEAAAVAARSGDPALTAAALEHADRFVRERQLAPRIAELTGTVSARADAGVAP